MHIELNKLHGLMAESIKCINGLQVLAQMPEEKERAYGDKILELKTDVKVRDARIKLLETTTRQHQVESLNYAQQCADLENRLTSTDNLLKISQIIRKGLLGDIKELYAKLYP